MEQELDRIDLREPRVCITWMDPRVRKGDGVYRSWHKSNTGEKDLPIVNMFARVVLAQARTQAGY